MDSLDMQIKEFESNRSLFENLAEDVESIINNSLIDEGINFLDVFSRVKSSESLKTKLNHLKIRWRKIQDLVGIRIIAYTSSDIKKICEIIESNFKIDSDLSTNKSDLLGLDKVGYRSFHYIASLGESREKLLEYKKYNGLKFEIQVRTLLENAWCEIQHDRNYKYGGELPNHIKRRFNLISGTLELIDNEFEDLSKEIDDYTNKINEEIKTDEKNISINKISLTSYIETSQVVGRIDEYISSIINSKLRKHGSMQKELKILKFFKISNISYLDKILIKYEEKIKEFANLLLSDAEKENESFFERGICIFYLGYVLAIKGGSLQEINDYRRKVLSIKEESFSNKLLSFSQKLF